MVTKSDLLKAQRDEHGYNFCTRCLKNRSSIFRLDEHHLIFKSEAPNHKEMDNELNKILVCNICHDWYHNDKSRRNNLIQERGLNELFSKNFIR